MVIIFNTNIWWFVHTNGLCVCVYFKCDDDLVINVSRCFVCRYNRIFPFFFVHHTRVYFNLICFSLCDRRGDMYLYFRLFDLIFYFCLSIFCFVSNFVFFTLTFLSNNCCWWWCLQLTHFEIKKKWTDEQMFIQHEMKQNEKKIR